MWRVVVCIAIGVSFLGTTACGNKKGKRVAMNKTAGKGDASKISQTLNKAIEGKDVKCLPVQKLFAALAAEKSAMYIVYHSDLDLGTLDNFLSKRGGDAKASKSVFFFKGESERPAVEFHTPAELEQSKLVGRYLRGIDVSADCKTASIVGGKGQNPNADFKSGDRNQVTVYDRKNDEMIQYVYARNGRILITVYRETIDRTECRDIPNTMKVTYTISWGEGTQSLSLEPGFAKLLTDHTGIKTQTTTKEAAAKGKAPEREKSKVSSVRVDFSHYFHAIQMIKEQKFSTPVTCQAK